ncbi:9635_t:CDS:2, partial [Cetraspora pellucida]
PTPRSNAVSSYGAPCGLNYTVVNQTTISTFPIKGNVTLDLLHATNGTLFYYYSTDGINFVLVADSKKYIITNPTGENVTTSVDLSKAGATVGSQGILQSVYLEGNNTSPTNTTLYECADIKITAEGTPPGPVANVNQSAGSINVPQ